ncbi:cutinase family protein [Microbacterium paraoxydans]|uniref:cutinase family protein n=1 Tax=Microbacterium paraoxydans TaxID=199592 RepID=UPI0030137783
MSGVAPEGSPATAANYIPGMNANRAKLVEEINYVNQQCPYSPIVLAGYSQGADVVLTALTVMPNQPNITSAARANIKAVPVFGDPTFLPNKGYNDVYAGTGLGVNPRLNTADLDAMKYWGWPQGATTQQGWVYKIRSYCKSYDYFCQSNPTNNGMLIHGTYSVTMASAVSWVQFMLTSWD